jgi:hypothetical protein
VSTEREFAALFFGCRATLTVGLAGATCSWYPSPSRLSMNEQKRLHVSFATWRDRCLREFARERGLVLRVSPGRREVVKLVEPGCAAVELAPEYPIVMTVAERQPSSEVPR